MLSNDRYTDAFWFVVPIPLAVAVATAAVVWRPSPLAAVALGSDVAAGACVELVLVRRLRSAWERGHWLSDTKVAAPIMAVVLALVGWGILTWRGHDVDKQSWGGAAVFALGLVGFYAALFVVIWLVQRAQGRRREGR